MFWVLSTIIQLPLSVCTIVLCSVDTCEHQSNYFDSFDNESNDWFIKSIMLTTCRLWLGVTVLL